MRKQVAYAVLIALCAALLAFSGAAFAQKAEAPAKMQAKAEGMKPAMSPSTYTQEKPYSKDFFGPWDEGMAKLHIPEITYEKTDSGLKVMVKVDNHPMDPKKPHYIMWIILEDGDGNPLGQTEFVATDPAPVTTFNLTFVPSKLKAFERCNIHGIWMSETDVKAE
jgi:desulfoferrodoxin-like iron-binding protein